MDINFKQNDFFSSKLIDIKNTIPFTPHDIYQWINNNDINGGNELSGNFVDSTYFSNYSNNNDKSFIFDVSLCTVIEKNEPEFISFLTKLAKSSSGTSSISGTDIANSDILNIGKIITTSANTPTPSNTSSAKNTNYQIPLIINDIDGGVSNLYGMPGMQQCNFREKCTLDHLHYTNCAQQTDKTTGKCSCICTGTPVLNDTPHSHCSEFKGSDDSTSDSLAAYNSILSTLFSSGITTTTTTSLPNEYKLLDKENKLNKLVYMLLIYYLLLKINNDYRKNLSDLNSVNATNDISLKDAKIKYKNKYLNLFNILSGIIILGVCIYYQYKKK